MKINIATWNIGEDETNEKNVVTLDSYKKIKEMIDKYSIDIISFQEAITSKGEVMPIRDYIKENTDLKYSSQLETSPSHINIGSMMGVVTCSKYPIEKSEIIMFENPHLENKYGIVMRDKGFILSYIEQFKLLILNGHGMPFFMFKENFDKFEIMNKKMEDSLIAKMEEFNNYVVLGDINYSNFSKMFPNIYDVTNSAINGITFINKNSKLPFQLDYIMTSKNIEVIDSKIIDTRFDHKLCLSTIEVK